MNPDAAPSGGTPVDPMELREDAVLLDALGRGEPQPPGDPLAAMLAAWRDDIRVDVADPPAAVVPRGKVGRSTRRRRVGVLSLAATALLAGGGVAAAHEARPGSVLWPVTEWTYPDLAASRSVQADLADAQRAAREGRTGDAHRLLDRAEQQVGRVDTPAEAERLRGRIEALRRSLPATVDGFPGRPPAGPRPGGHETPPPSPTTSASIAPAKRGNAEPGGPDRPAGREPGGPSRPDDRGPKPAKSHHRPR